MTKTFTTTRPDFTEQVGTAASWEDEARRLLTECCYTINGLSDQQAMPDNSHQQLLTSIGDLLQQPPIPAEHPQQDWCDHCSGDLEQPVPEVKGRTTTHVICEKCYRKFAGPRWFDPDFDPTKGSPETPWLTERARQQVELIIRTSVGDEYLNPLLIERLAEFASEAAMARDNDWLKWLDDKLDCDSREEAEHDFSVMAQSYSYLKNTLLPKRVAEAATAALEQAAQKMKKLNRYILSDQVDGCDIVRDDDGNYLLYEDVIAAIGDDKEQW